VPIPSLVAGSVALKIAAVATALSLGGVGYAAHEGSLPDPAQEVAHQLLGSVGVPAANEAGENGHGPDATGPAAVGLCRAFAAGAKDEHGSALDSPALQALATAAGGVDQVAAYCEQVLADSAAHRPDQTPPAEPASSNAPSEPGQPTDLPTRSADHPTGPPDTVPTDHPAGQPSVTPSAGH
jgi:hypothetical protein